MTNYVANGKRPLGFIPAEGRGGVLVRLSGLLTMPRPSKETAGILPSLFSCDVDGVIADARTIREQANSFRGRRSPALLISVDWADDLTHTQGVTSVTDEEAGVRSAVKEAFNLGASAIATCFFVGHRNDQDEARNFAFVSKLIDECDELGLPALVGAVPIGDRPTKETYVDCVGLAGRMASEAGASFVAIPYAGSQESVQRTVEVMGVPTYLMELGEKMSEGQPDCELEDLLSTAVKTKSCGVVLLASGGPRGIEKVKRAVDRLHGGDSF